MIYTTGPVRVRPFYERDMNREYFGWFHDPEVTRYNSHGLFPYTKKKQLEFVRDLENPTSRIVWAIEIQRDRPLLEVKFGERPVVERHEQHETYWKVVGNCSLQSINWQYRSAEFAIVIGDREAWGKGVATAALKMVLGHAFYKLGLHRVWTGTAATNVGMMNVALKAGMRHEGVFRDGMFLDGKFTNIMCFAVLEKEFFEKEREERS
jgi:[ribosomal protein S5]-alanine N-acetyltransferase